MRTVKVKGRDHVDFYKRSTINIKGDMYEIVEAIWFGIHSNLKKESYWLLKVK
jgi:hypothetical protein